MKYIDDNKAPLTVVNILSGMIFNAMEAQAREEYAPGHDPDKMDDIIKHNKKLAYGLRKIRAEFEELVTGVCSVHNETPMPKRNTTI